jgi:hypothetical protein
MSRRRLAAASVLTILAVAAATASASAQPPANDTLLTGTFQMSGRVTVANNVRGEQVGQLVTRTWTFTPQCATAPCATVQLVRGRAGGTDTVTLVETPTGAYAGSAVFYAPLRCSGHIFPRGQEIPFRITVRITATNGTSASAISATYVNRRRTNLTPCIGVLGHDSARYTGVLAPG